MEKGAKLTKFFLNRRLLHLFYILAGVWFLTGTAQGQTTISGTVKDAATGQTLPGVNIQIEGTFTGTVSDIDGAFEIRTGEALPLTLRFSFVGYQTQVVALEAASEPLEVVMPVQTINTNEVIVTAQHRDQLVQQIPMSVAVIDRRFIARANEIDDPSDLIAYVPGFSGKNYKAVGSWYTIRGINTNAFSVGYDPSVALFHDGIYNGRTNAVARPFFDVDRVEVLKGPQGSLFGRNAVAGVVSIHTNRPLFLRDLSLELGTGNWGQALVKPIINWPIGKKVAIRYAGYWEQRDGIRTVTNFDDHQLGKKDLLANRFSLLFRPTSTLNFLLRLEQLHSEGGGQAMKSTNPEVGASTDPFARELMLDFLPDEVNDFYTASLHTNWVMSEQTSLKFVTGFNTHEQSAFKADVDGSPTPVAGVRNPNSFSNFSQELRLNGKTHRLDWLVATSFFWEEVDFDLEVLINDYIFLPALLGPSGLPADFCLKNPGCRIDASEKSFHKGFNTSWGVYGNFIYAFTDQFKVTAGLRYSIDQKELKTRSSLGEGMFHALSGFNVQGPVDTTQNKDTWTSLQPQLSLQYELNPFTMIYGGYSRGYKAGGHNLYTANAFKPEINNAFEIGLKSNLLQNRIKFNLAAYYMLFKNQQVEFIRNNIVEISNAGKTVSPGFEIESTFELGHGLSLIGNAGFNFAKYRDFVIPAPMDPTTTLDFTGNIPNRSPRTQFSLIGQYSTSIPNFGLFFIRADYCYQSKEFYSRENIEERSFEGYGLLNARVGIEDLFGGKIDFSLFGSNITDTDYLVHVFSSIDGGFPNINGVPRLYGVRVKIKNVFNP